MAFNICGDSPVDKHAGDISPVDKHAGDISPVGQHAGDISREPRQSVDITVTECPNLDELDLRRFSMDTQTSDKSYPRDSSTEDEDQGEYPDRISPLEFMASWKDKVRSNSLPAAVIRDGFLGGSPRYMCNELRVNGMSPRSQIHDGCSHTILSNQAPMKRPIALRLGSSESVTQLREEQGRVHRLMSHPTILYTNAPTIETTELREKISRFTMFQPIGSPRRRDSLSPCRSPVRSPMSSRSPSPALSNRSLSPVMPRRMRSHTICGGPIHLSPQNATHMPRDACQPSHGSISDLGSSAEGGRGEEEDTYDLGPLERPRASTCPENRAWRRRARLKAQHRPPTPPPGSSPSFPIFHGKNRAKSAEELFARLVVDNNT